MEDLTENYCFKTPTSGGQREMLKEYHSTIESDTKGFGTTTLKGMHQAGFCIDFADHHHVFRSK
jgi:hypothetical protein